MRSWVKYTKCEAAKLGNFEVIFPAHDADKQHRFEARLARRWVERVGRAARRLARLV